MLVGNKVDLAESRAVSTEEAKEYATDSEMLFFETSALDATNVDAAFKTVFERIYERMPKSVTQKSDNNNNNIHMSGQNTIKLTPPSANTTASTNAATTTRGMGDEKSGSQTGGGCC